MAAPSNPELLARIQALESLLRPTPTVPLRAEGFRLFSKLEFANPAGSVKDRSAFGILQRAIAGGELHPGTTVIESSSGNFALSTATFCRMLGLQFVPVIDPNITPTNETLLRALCATVIKVDERDESGGFLKTRQRRVATLVAETEDSFWPNQYGNTAAMDIHYRLTAGEICDTFDRLDFIFVGVSSAGTIAGISRRVKEKFPAARVVAVDAEGSVLFGGPPRKRHIPGLGSSTVPDLLRHAVIDDVVLVPERETVRGCHALLREHGLFAGGSSGTAYAAVQRHADRIRAVPDAHVLFLCADRGAAYADTIYDPAWVAARELD